MDMNANNRAKMIQLGTVTTLLGLKVDFTQVFVFISLHAADMTQPAPIATQVCYTNSIWLARFPILCWYFIVQDIKYLFLWLLNFRTYITAMLLKSMGIQISEWEKTSKTQEEYYLWKIDEEHLKYHNICQKYLLRNGPSWLIRIL